jgi:hypothetical protein
MSQYITDIAPYFAQDDQRYTSPVFQNAASQQANQNAALAQQNQQVQQAGQRQGGNVSALNPALMAAMLRKKKPEMMGIGETPDYSNPYAGYNNGASSGSSGIE